MKEAHQALQAGNDSKSHLAEEAADLLYHLLVLLASAAVAASEVHGILERRHAAAARPKAP